MTTCLVHTQEGCLRAEVKITKCQSLGPLLQSYGVTAENQPAGLRLNVTFLPALCISGKLVEWLETGS